MSFTKRILSFNEFLKEVNEYEGRSVTIAEYQADVEKWHSQLSEDAPFRRHFDNIYNFKMQIQEGDEIGFWSTLASFSGRAGYVLVRDGQASAYYITAIA